MAHCVLTNTVNMENVIYGVCLLLFLLFQPLLEVVVPIDQVVDILDNCKNETSEIICLFTRYGPGTQMVDDVTALAKVISCVSMWTIQGVLEG